MGRGIAGTVVALLLAVVAVPGAAQDLGCADFAWQEDAQAYFEAGGGSTAYDFAGLDPDHDGLACEDTLESGWGHVDPGDAEAGIPPGGLPQPTEAPPVDGAPPAAAPAVDSGVGGNGAIIGTPGGGGEVAVSALPDTGAGSSAPARRGASVWALFALAAVVLGVVGRRAVLLGA